MAAPMRNRAENSRVKASKEPERRETDDAFLTVLGRRVRSAREERELSRKQLAESADVSERYLAQLELGDGNASVTLLRRVSRALGVRLTQLIDDEERKEHQRIALIGLRGAGKSTLGSALAKQMRRPFVELDREVERELGMQLSEIFLLYGQPGYRKAERRCLDRIIRSQSEVILSIGGGVVSEPETFQTLLTHCYTVWIKASPAEHMSRVIAQGDMRPMKGHAQAMQDLKNILSSRETEYARADAVVDTSGKSIDKSLAALRRVVA
jgi:XRE family aerobic/anaerobic benzoate catabolism transcriptional regulator